MSTEDLSTVHIKTSLSAAESLRLRRGRQGSSRNQTSKSLQGLITEPDMANEDNTEVDFPFSTLQEVGKESNSSRESSSTSSPVTVFPMNSINGETMHLLSDEDEDVVAEPKLEESETFWSISVQIFIPFLIAGLGMVGAGLILDIVQHWPVFIKVPEVFILVPALLGKSGMYTI